MAEATLQVQARTERGKQGAKHLRNQGFVPGVLYGPGEQPSLLSIQLKDFLHLLHTRGRNVVVDLAVGDKKRKIKAFIYEIQHDPISGDIIHVDLKHISLKEKINVTIPIRLSGIPIGVKNEGGILEHLMHSIEITCLPTEIPDAITLDVSQLHTGGVIHVKDLPLEKLEANSAAEHIVAHVVAPKLHVAEEEKPEEVATAEPEVIGGKKEEEE
jgi:large subunit ribosomal protein L25